MSVSEQTIKDKIPKSPRVERMELYSPSQDTPKRKQKLLVHFSYVNQTSPTFRELFPPEDKPIKDLRNGNKSHKSS